MRGGDTALPEFVIVIMTFNPNVNNYVILTAIYFLKSTAKLFVNLGLKRNLLI